MTDPRKAAAEVVIAGRKRRGLTQRKFAKLTDVAEGTIKAIEAAVPDREYGQKVLGAISLKLGDENDEHLLWDILHPPSREGSPMMREFRAAVAPLLDRVNASNLERMDATDERISAIMAAIHDVDIKIDAVLQALGQPPAGN